MVCQYAFVDATDAFHINLSRRHFASRLKALGRGIQTGNRIS
jgi:hypothetical protein